VLWQGRQYHKNLDDKRYKRKFTPRTNKQKWSAINISRMKRLIKDGRMTQAGLSRIDPYLIASGSTLHQPYRALHNVLSDDLLSLIKENP
jgi:uncharacterized protein YdeI (YjbR/CyaY-like superfamily)